MMKRILVLGAGTGGTIMVNKLRKALDRATWEITVVDQEKRHFYQPGFLFIPFGIYDRSDVVKPKADFFPAGVNVLYKRIEKVDTEQNRVILEDGVLLAYDFLVISTGVQTRPDQTKGLADHLWNKDIFDFYTLEGAIALRERFRGWEGGRLVMNIAEIPFKCPVAPLEFVFLADYFFHQKGIRDKVEISLVTPLSGAFTKPQATKMLSGLLEQKNIEVIPDFYLSHVDNDTKEIVSYDERRVPFDLLTIVPVNMGDSYVERSGLGDDLNLIPTDKYTLQAKEHTNIFVIGDAADIPTSKAGSVAHFAADIAFENLISLIEGRKMHAKFDGHANCYIETGFGEGSLIDFNYETEPLPGTFPLPGIGPFGLLKNTKMNHYGKMIFRWIYWHLLIKGKQIPIQTEMTMAGKKR